MLPDPARSAVFRTRLVFLFLGLVLVFPFAALAFFNVPSSDDFAYASWQRAWGTINANLTCYMGWGGRYVSNLLLTACNPLSYSANPDYFLVPYQVHSLVLLALLLVSFALLVRRMFFRIPISGTWGGLSFLILLFFLGNPNELLYWMAGSYTYGYGLIFALLAVYYVHQPEKSPAAFPPRNRLWLWIPAALALCGLWVFRKSLIAFLDPLPGLFLVLVLGTTLFLVFLPFRLGEKPVSRPFKTLLLSACMFLAVGSNEIYAFLLGPYVFWILVGRSLESRRVLGLGLFWLAVAGIAAVLNLFAPSTFARQKLQQDRLTTFDLRSASDWLGVLDYLPGLIPAALWVLTLFLFLPGSGQNVQPVRKPHDGLRRLASLAGLGFVLLVLPIGLSTLSGPLPERTLNPLMAAALLLVLALVRLEDPMGARLRPFRFLLLGGSLLLTVAWVSLSPRPPFWYRSLAFLTHGDAPASLARHKERFHLLNRCTEPVCTIPLNPWHPEDLLAPENAILESDPPSWKNYKRFSFAAYYQKKAIIAR